MPLSGSGLYFLLIFFAINIDWGRQLYERCVVPGGCVQWLCAVVVCVCVVYLMLQCANYPVVIGARVRDCHKPQLRWPGPQFAVKCSAPANPHITLARCQQLFQITKITTVSLQPSISIQSNIHIGPRRRRLNFTRAPAQSCAGG